MKNTGGPPAIFTSICAPNDTKPKAELYWRICCRNARALAVRWINNVLNGSGASSTSGRCEVFPRAQQWANAGGRPIFSSGKLYEPQMLHISFIFPRRWTGTPASSCISRVQAARGNCTFVVSVVRIVVPLENWISFRCLRQNALRSLARALHPCLEQYFLFSLVAACWSFRCLRQNALRGLALALHPCLEQYFLSSLVAPCWRQSPLSLACA